MRLYSAHCLSYSNLPCLGQRGIFQRLVSRMSLSDSVPCFCYTMSQWCRPSVFVLGLELLACNFLLTTMDQEMPKEDEPYNDGTYRRRFSLNIAVLVDPSWFTV